MKGIFYIHYNAPGNDIGAWVFGSDGDIDTAFAALAVGDSYQGGILKYAAKWMDVVTTADGTLKLTGQLEASIGSAYGQIGPIVTNQELSGGGEPDNPLRIAVQGATDGQVLAYDATQGVWEPTSNPPGTGDVDGPASSTDNGFARFDGAGGKTLQNTGTGATLSDTGDAVFNTVAILDSNDSHTLQILTSSNLTANHTLTLVPGDADRTVTINNNVTLYAYVPYEVPAGAVDGVNTAFTFANSPVSANFLLLFLNGVRLTPGVDYTVAGAVATIIAPAQIPQVGDEIFGTYSY